MLGVDEGPHASEWGDFTLEEIEFVKRYSALKLKVMLRLARLPEPLSVERGVELHRVTYWTEHLDAPVLASGLLAVPRGVAPHGSVTWLNGTNPTRSEAPSSGGNVAFCSPPRSREPVISSSRPTRGPVGPSHEAGRDLARCARSGDHPAGAGVT